MYAIVSRITRGYEPKPFHCGFISSNSSTFKSFEFNSKWLFSIRPSNYILLLRVNCYFLRQVNCRVPLRLIVKSRVDICCGIFIARVFEIPTWLLYLRWWIVVLSSVRPRYLVVRESNHRSLACRAIYSYSSHHSQESCWVVDCYVIMCQCSTWLPSYFWPKSQNFIAIVWPIPSICLEYRPSHVCSRCSVTCVTRALLVLKGPTGSGLPIQKAQSFQQIRYLLAHPCC